MNMLKLPVVSMYRNYYFFLFICLLFFSCNNENGAEETFNENRDTVMQEVVEENRIIVFGNSLTAGYGLEPSQAFPALLQMKIDSLNLPYTVVNAGISGETSSGGLGRIDWILEQRIDIFILELGANDGLRGIPLAETQKNLQEIIDRVSQKYPDAKIILAGMQIPPNMGRQYTLEFREIFPSLAKKNNALLIPFLLEGVGGEPHLNLDDGIHPNIEGHKIVAMNVWKILAPVINK